MNKAPFGVNIACSPIGPFVPAAPSVCLSQPRDDAERQGDGTSWWRSPTREPRAPRPSAARGRAILSRLKRASSTRAARARRPLARPHDGRSPISPGSPTVAGCSALAWPEQRKRVRWTAGPKSESHQTGVCVCGWLPKGINRDPRTTKATDRGGGSPVSSGEGDPPSEPRGSGDPARSALAR